MNNRVISSKFLVAIIMILILAIGAIGAVVVATTQDNSTKGGDITIDNGTDMIPPSDGVVYDLEAEAKAAAEGNVAMVYYAPSELSNMNDAEVVGGKEYPNLSYAISGVPYGATGTVRILKDLTVERLEIHGERNLTIDLNQKTITSSAMYTGIVMFLGSLTIKNGTILAADYCSAIASHDATVNIINCTIKSERYATETYGGKLNIVDSVVSSLTANAIHLARTETIISGANTLITSANPIPAENGAGTIQLWPGSVVNIQGGKVQNTTGMWAIWHQGAEDNVTISDDADVGMVGPTSGKSLIYRANAADASGYVNGYIAHPYNFNHTVRTNSFVRNGYGSVGWNTKADGTGTNYVPGERITTLHSSIDLYAQWVDRFGLKLNLNSGILDNPPTEYRCSEALPLPSPTKTGYTFGGWYSNEELTGTAITTITATDAGDKEFWAKWTANDYYLKLHTNGGTRLPLAYYAYGTGIELPITTRKGYTFAGWYGNVDLSGTAITTITTTDIGDKEFWAKWINNIYTVQFHTNGGKSLPLEYYTYDIGIELPISTRRNFIFAGWYSNEELTGTAITLITAEDVDDKEFWAKWIGITYQVKLNSDGGTNTALTSYIYDKGATLPVPAKTGYTFVGWYNNVGLSGTAITSITTTDTGNKEFWAKFTAIAYTITWIVEGYPNETKFDYGSIPSFDAIKYQDTQYTYAFSGWRRKGYKEVADPIAVVGNETYTATFTKHLRDFAIIIDTPKGTPTMDGGKVEYGKEYKFKVEQKKGYSYKNMVVKAGGEVLIIDADGYYTVSSVNGDLKIEIDGVEKNSNAWWIILVVMIISGGLIGLFLLYKKSKSTGSRAGINLGEV